ncbi:LOW QUALITY PROTEIN: transcriptional regulator, partial [Rhodococcus opacus PD630]
GSDQHGGRCRHRAADPPSPEESQGPDRERRGRGLQRARLPRGRRRRDRGHHRDLRPRPLPALPEQVRPARTRRHHDSRRAAGGRGRRPRRHGRARARRPPRPSDLRARREHHREPQGRRALPLGGPVPRGRGSHAHPRRLRSRHPVRGGTLAGTAPRTHVRRRHDVGGVDAERDGEHQRTSHHSRDAPARRASEVGVRIDPARDTASRRPDRRKERGHRCGTRPGGDVQARVTDQRGREDLRPARLSRLEHRRNRRRRRHQRVERVPPLPQQGRPSRSGVLPRVRPAGRGHLGGAVHRHRPRGCAPQTRRVLPGTLVRESGSAVGVLRGDREPPEERADQSPQRAAPARRGVGPPGDRRAHRTLGSGGTVPGSRRAGTGARHRPPRPLRHPRGIACASPHPDDGGAAGPLRLSPWTNRPGTQPSCGASTGSAV